MCSILKIVDETTQFGGGGESVFEESQEWRFMVAG